MSHGRNEQVLTASKKLSPLSSSSHSNVLNSAVDAVGSVRNETKSAAIAQRRLRSVQPRRFSTTLLTAKATITLSGPRVTTRRCL